jgi:hypothetical protein
MTVHCRAFTEVMRINSGTCNVAVLEGMKTWVAQPCGNVKPDIPARDRYRFFYFRRTEIDPFMADEEMIVLASKVSRCLESLR